MSSLMPLGAGYASSVNCGTELQPVQVRPKAIKQGNIMPLSFKPIPSRTGQGYTCLSITLPGEWFDEPTYRPFIGGGGLGACKTLATAKEKLLAAAIACCHRNIREAELEKEFYQKQLKILKKGLVTKR